MQPQKGSAFGPQRASKNKKNDSSERQASLTCEKSPHIMNTIRYNQRYQEQHMRWLLLHVPVAAVGGSVLPPQLSIAQDDRSNRPAAVTPVEASASLCIPRAADRAGATAGRVAGRT